ncbi:MAG: SPOR domain-containing protein [Candidatus Omnitrophica bacterium]|nr:SPOR domain-containing protein [Candidatus Omnitrophota bacterium]MDD5429724.1 SPOR domain-containing protein [Candidatus Omnitrophota bacterium]
MESKQLYLFGAQNEPEKKSLRYKVVLPLDALILLTAVLIIFLVFAFSLGIERGKNIAMRSSDTNNESTLLAEQNLTADQKPIQQAFIRPQAESSKNKEKNDEEETKLYHIQVASFCKEVTAEKEAENLKDKGYQVLVLTKGKYAVVYVGGFKNENQAKETLQVLKKTYSDCILRRL